MQWNIRPLHVVLFLSLLALLQASAHPAFAAPQPMSGQKASFPYSGSLECPAPPARWNPTNATAAQLRFYGLPLPTAHVGSVYQAWVDHMQHATQRLCTPSAPSNTHTDPYHFGPDTSNGTYWSGYIVTNFNNYGFDEASADWTVPCYSHLNPDAFQRALQWVGLGGYGATANLWQAGTETDWYEGYRFWYEYVPGNTILYAGPAVGCGNHVSVEVDYNYSVSGKSYLLMQNYSNGQYWSTQQSFVPNQGSAEWIVERTSCATNINNPKNYALSNTTNVNWSAAQAANTNNGNLGEPISWYAYSALSMSQNGVDLSDNSGLGSGGGSFTTYYHNSGISYC